MTLPSQRSDTADPSDDLDAMTDRPHRRPGRPSLADQTSSPDARAEILRQARRLFMQRGFADVAVGEVAQLAGVTKPTLYYHFQSKQGLYAAVLCDLIREVGGYIAEVIALDLSVRERLWQLTLGYFAHARSGMEPVFRDTIELIGPELASEVMAAYDASMFTPIAELLSVGMAKGEIAAHDPELLTRAFFGLLDAFTGADKFDRYMRAGHLAPRQPTDRPLCPPSARAKANAAEAHQGAFQTHPPYEGSAEQRRLADLVVTLFLDGVGRQPER